MELKYKILALNSGYNKKGEKWFGVSIYANWSTSILNCFVSQEVFDLFENGTINDQNVADYITFRYSQGKIYLSCNIK